MIARVLAACLVVAAVSSPARAVNLLPSLDDGGIGLIRPSGQEFLDFIPKGGLGDDPWEPGVAIGQFAASLVLSTGGAVLFTLLEDKGTMRDIWEVRKGMFVNTILDTLITPLVAGTAVWGMGFLSDMYSVGYFIPLGIDYLVTIVLGAVRTAFIYGIIDMHHGETVSKAVDVIGAYLYVDWILHALLVPAATVFFSQRSRDVNMYMGARDLPSPALAAEVRGTYRSLCDEREEQARASEPSAGTHFTLASVRF